MRSTWLHHLCHPLRVGGESYGQVIIAKRQITIPPLPPYKGRFFTGSPAFAPPSPCQGEGWGEGASRRRLFPLTQTLSPSRGEGDDGGLAVPSRKKTYPRKQGEGLRVRSCTMLR